MRHLSGSKMNDQSPPGMPKNLGPLVSAIDAGTTCEQNNAKQKSDFPI